MHVKVLYEIKFNPGDSFLIDVNKPSNYDIWLSDWTFIAEDQNARTFPSIKIPANEYYTLKINKVHYNSINKGFLGYPYILINNKIDLMKNTGG